MVSWKRMDIDVIKNYCDTYVNRYGVYPSMRDIFYVFVDKLWPNNLYAYQGLSKWLTEKRFNGDISWRVIRDGSGRELSTTDDYGEHEDDFFERKLRYFKEFKDCHENFYLPRWRNQPHKVIVLCEKEADYPILQSLLGRIDVAVGFLRGYSGKRIMFEMVEEILEDEDKIPHIILLGDFDPSGIDIKRNVKVDANLLGVDVTPIDIAVTKEQVEKFKLPHRPDDVKEIKKLQDDPRFLNWPYGLYRVETAALRVQQPDYFDNLIRQSVLQFFDEKVYEQVLKDQEEKRELIKEKIEEVLEGKEDD